LKLNNLLAILLVACLASTFAIIPAYGDSLQRTDFAQESFGKVIDYFDYARAVATTYGLPSIPAALHAYTYVTYVNKMGLQMLYAGLCNVSLLDQVFLTIPLQTILLHYKTETNKRDALVGSSFLMLMGFNDSSKSIYSNSPDKNDTLWASFSFDLSLNLQNATLPSLNSKCEIFPLTSSDDKLTWKWGMRYTNLTAFWITTFINEENETDTARPWGFATYDELTFNYTLTIDPTSHTATISEDHIIGRIRDLWTFWGWILIWPQFAHYNSTGAYWGNMKVSNETVYDFLYKHNVKMSIVEFQTSILFDRQTYCASANGQNVTNNDVLVGNSSISTYADDGEKIFDAAFGVKDTYNLFNYTEDQTESTAHAYDAVVRTTEITGYTKNDDLFKNHREFAKFLPHILMHMYPAMYQKAKESITNMTKADYLFLISYPTYSGYRVEHDPLFTAYFAPVAAVGPNLGGIIVIAAVAGVAILIAAVVLKKRRGKPIETWTEQPPTTSVT
jgi:hypothetical protein